MAGQDVTPANFEFNKNNFKIKKTNQPQCSLAGL